jgi:hypothetical protein
MVLQKEVIARHGSTCYNPSTQEADQQDHEYESSLGCIERLSQKTKVGYSKETKKNKLFYVCVT